MTGVSTRLTRSCSSSRPQGDARFRPALVGQYAPGRRLFQAGVVFNDQSSAHVECGVFALEKLPRWFVYGSSGTLKIDDFSAKSGRISKINNQYTVEVSEGVDPVVGSSRTMAPLRPEQISMSRCPRRLTRPTLFTRTSSSPARIRPSSPSNRTVFAAHAGDRCRFLVRPHAPVGRCPDLNRTARV